MEAVGVLGHDRGEVAGGLELRQRQMTRVRSRGQHRRTPFARDQPVLLRILEKVLECRDLDRVVLPPEAALTPKRRDAALGRNAGAGQRDAAASARDKLGGAGKAHSSRSPGADDANTS